MVECLKKKRHKLTFQQETGQSSQDASQQEEAGRMSQDAPQQEGGWTSQDQTSQDASQQEAGR